MNRHAKASSCGSHTRQSRAKLLLASIAVLALTLALGVAAASALSPSVAIEDAFEAQYTTAKVRGYVNPEGKTTSYRFQYATAPDFTGATNGPQGSLKAGTEALEVSGELTALQAHTTYYLRLIAENADGTNEAVAASSFETLEADTPLVDQTYVSGVSTSEATLNAKVNPRGAATTYHFQYVDQAGYEASEFTSATSTPNQPLTGPANPDDIATAGISGLQSGATYYYRVLASNSKGDVEGPARFLHTYANASEEPDSCANAGRRAEQQATLLPDCRAWEMASPPDKNGGDVVPSTQRTRAAIDGSAVNYLSLVGSGDVHGGTVGTEYIAQRTGAPGTSGWQTHGISPTQDPLPALGSVAPNLDPAYDLLSPDLSSGIFRAYRPLAGTPDRVAGLLNLYTREDLRTPGSGSYQVISDPGFAIPPGDLPNEGRFPQTLRPWVAGGSSDLSQVIFESEVPLTTDASGTAMKLFESVDGALRLAGRVPPLGPDQCNLTHGAPPCAPGEDLVPGPRLSECDDATDAPACEAAPTSQAGLGASRYRPTPHMISADGSRVFFQAGGNAYMRVNGTTTVQLNASEKSTPEDAGSATLWTASEDGSRIFFSTSEDLVDEDEGHNNPDYYMYDVNAAAGQHLTLVSRDGEPAEVDGELGIIGASEDGHYLYFMMSGQLVAGEDPLVAGIYVWHDGDIHYIGSFERPSNFISNTLDAFWATNNLADSARVSTDGSHVAFVATDDGGLRGRGGFSGFDHGTACAGVGGGCLELYVYNANDGKLRCASCDPSGAPPTESVRVNAEAENYSSITANTAYIHRALSADGRWAFFSSPDPLVPEDTNGKFDAYSYDTVNDEVYLLSSGTSDDDSYFMDASGDGRDAFFTTREQLVGWDVDKSFDVYDARVGGGLPEPAPVPGPCEGDSCHAASAPPPGAAPLGSTQQGLGNPKQRPCAKGKHSARKAGKTRCVANRHKRNAKNNRRAGR